jgi:uncharacterized membrane protein
MQEPGGTPPYGQTPYQPPIPSPDAGSGYGAIPPSGPAQINFDVIGRAWTVLQPTLGTWVVAFLIYIVIIGAFSGAMSAVMGTSARPIPMPSGNGFPSATGAMPNIPLMMIGNLVQFVVVQFLIGGLYRMAINQVRTGQLTLGDMFSVTDVLPSLLGAALLSGLATFLGLLLCIIPGLIVSGLLMFTIPLVVDQRMGAVDAMSASWNVLKSQAAMAVVFLIVIGLLAGAGAIACFVGMLVTGPLAILSLATLYRDFFPHPAGHQQLA